MNFRHTSRSREGAGDEDGEEERAPKFSRQCQTMRLVA